MKQRESQSCIEFSPSPSFARHRAHDPFARVCRVVGGKRAAELWIRHSVKRNTDVRVTIHFAERMCKSDSEDPVATILQLGGGNPHILPIRWCVQQRITNSNLYRVTRALQAP